MTEILATATAVAPITAALVEALKKTGYIPKNLTPISALLVGFLLGAASLPVFEIALAHAMWAGGISGLAAVGLFELGKQSKGGRTNANDRT
ncbi:holin [Salibacterium lacus]|uniref:Holin n=1 Tax=Salibacterium lacus TaxID=1898109 RepID=A0ABW5SWF4_9BACI